MDVSLTHIVIFIVLEVIGKLIDQGFGIYIRLAYPKKGYTELPWSFFISLIFDNAQLWLKLGMPIPHLKNPTFL
jgi:hypothetical protein